MQEKKTIFQYVIMGTFAILFMIGFALFATYKGGGAKKDEVRIGRVVIWGTIDERIINELITEIKDEDEKYNDIEYFEKSKGNFQSDILEALATGNAPDLIILSNSEFMQNKNKLLVVPYDFISQREYLETFADAFSVYLDNNGIYGIPFTIDPMVLYYNKRLFASNRVVVPPKKWEELTEANGIVSRLTKLDDNNNILKSAIALGESMNVNHYKEILYTLFFQTGNNVIEHDLTGDFYVSDAFSGSKGDIIKFYSEFSDETNKINYTWNKSRNSSEEEFLAGNLAIYLGFVSEIRKIRLKNPNLNFYVAEMPSFDKTEINRIYAKTWVMAIPKLSKNTTGAFYTALKFASNNIQALLGQKIYLPPVRKDMLNKVPDNAFKDIFYREAIYGRTVLEPGAWESNRLFSDFINSVNTNLMSPASATKNLGNELKLLMSKY